MSEAVQKDQPVRGATALLTVNLPVDGIHCAGCISRVEGALGGVPGVAEASVNLATGEARVSFDPGSADLQELLAAVEGVGYRVPVGVAEVAVEGMHCAACVSRVERVMGRGVGVLGAEVSLATESAQLRFVPGVMDFASLGAAAGKSRVPHQGGHRGGIRGGSPAA